MMSRQVDVPTNGTSHHRPVEMSPLGRVAIVRPYLVAENQMCFVAAHADASETIDGMTLRRQAKKRA
jgi:hypothetical protein